MVNVGFIDSITTLPITVAFSPQARQNYAILDHPKFNINNVNVVIPFSLLAVNFTETYTKRNKLFYLATVSYQFWS